MAAIGPAIQEHALKEEVQHAHDDQQSDQENNTDNPEYDFHDLSLIVIEFSA